MSRVIAVSQYWLSASWLLLEDEFVFILLFILREIPCFDCVRWTHINCVGFCQSVLDVDYEGHPIDKLTKRHHSVNLKRKNPGYTFCREFRPIFFSKSCEFYYDDYTVTSVLTRNTLDRDQSNYSARIVFSHIPIEFGQKWISAILSANPENPTVEPNMKWIGRPLAEIWPFEWEVGRSVGPQ